MFAKDLSNKIFSPPRHEGTKFNQSKFIFCVLVPLWLFFPACPGWDYALNSLNPDWA